MSMNYKERLKEAADLVISSDHHQSDVLPLNYDEIGIKATLKPHQIQGILWLIQRYLTGVNFILAKFCPKLRVLRYVGDKEVRRDLRRKPFEQANTDFPFDVLLTTYDIVLMDKGISFSNSMALCCN
ncbi:hypothetical protein C5167_051153 [Papaver somniferum]|uniref:Uncharacterized protein n=1 Tax=Papaver somniferum TaxID=3469 RepID=A0A4Y7KU77_PAPSO|nr:hypothetical protein C5167_051153 [Papaver somniferum]